MKTSSDMDSNSRPAPVPWKRVDATLLATARVVRQTYDNALSVLGISLPEASTVSLVAESGPLTQTQIATALETGRAVTGVRIDSLEQGGYVRRLPASNDRRVWLIEATRAGRDLAAEITVVDEHVRESLRSGISRREREMLSALLVKIAKNAECFAEELLGDTPSRTGS